jgi:hypothetical protein
MIVVQLVVDLRRQRVELAENVPAIPGATVIGGHPDVRVEILMIAVPAGILMSGLRVETLMTAVPAGMLMTGLRVETLMTAVPAGMPMTAVLVGMLMTAARAGMLMTAVPAGTLIIAVFERNPARKPIGAAPRSELEVGEPLVTMMVGSANRHHRNALPNNGLMKAR